MQKGGSVSATESIPGFNVLNSGVFPKDAPGNLTRSMRKPSIFCYVHKAATHPKVRVILSKLREDPTLSLSNKPTLGRLRATLSVSSNTC